MLKIYAARGMTGRIKEEVVKEAADDRSVFAAHEVIVLDPVSAEGVEPTKEKLVSSKKAMDSFWPRDKEMIREANIVFDMSPHLNSEGVKHEIGYARYNLWKPVFRIFPKGQLPFKSSVAFFEDDELSDDLNEALRIAKEKYGTRQKRFKWRLNMLNRCLPKWIKYQLGEWK